MRALGANVYGGPHALESYGEDPVLRGELADAFDRGVRRNAMPARSIDGGVTSVNGAAARHLLEAQLTFHLSREAAEPPGVPALSDDHRALARAAAGRSIVLLENDEVDGMTVLPLSPRALRTVALVGRLADTPASGATVLDGLRVALPDAEILHAASDEPGDAAAAARRADVAVVVVGGERSSLRLQPVDAELIRTVAAANRRTVVVALTAGAVVTDEWRDAAPAIVLAWTSAMDGHVLADVLLGRADVAGRLPFSIDGAYPLGFGLSYTEFALTNLTVGALDGDGFDAVVTATNVGVRAGRTVLQLYGRAEADDLARRELLGFETIVLGAGAGAQVRVRGSIRRLRRAGGSVVVEAAAFSGDPNAVRSTVSLRCD